LFGSSMHFHGMYLMSFLDTINEGPHGPIISGFMGDALTGAGLFEADELHSKSLGPLILPNYSTHWSDDELDQLLKVDLSQALQQTVTGIRSEIDGNRGVWFQKMIMLVIFERVRFFTYFQCTLGDYWRGLSAPFMNREYSRFCLSLPRTALDGRRLLRDVYRHHYGLISTIPGTYAEDPLILTGRYLLKRHIARALPAALRHGPFRGYQDVQLRMDVDSLQATGMEALWPIQEAWERLSDWVDIRQVEAAYQAAMSNHEDIRPLRKLQSIQTLAYRLLDR
jgi:hypothetical protein